MIDKILSRLKSAPTSDFIYSSMSFLGRRHGGELPGSWFVAAIGSLGIAEDAIRQTLFRMERNGAILARRSGRVKLYRPSPATLAIMDAGVWRVQTPAPLKWDGVWTIVHFRVGEEDRDIRDRLREVLLVEGYGAVGPALYLHPRNRATRLMTAAQELGLSGRINVFRGRHAAGMGDRRLVDELWNLDSLADRYRKFIRRFSPIVRTSRAWTGKEAFGLRFAFMFEFFRISWDDPALPLSLLTAEWPGEEARKIADRLMSRLLPGAICYGEEVLNRLLKKTETG